MIVSWIVEDACYLAGLVSSRCSTRGAVVSRAPVGTRAVRSASSIKRRVSVTVQAASASGMPVTAGKVRNVSPAEYSKLVSEGWTVLDVRPPNEIQKAKLQHALEVPMYVPDEDQGISTLIKKATAFGMGGWWLGGTHMKPNEKFLSEVQASIPDKEQAKVLVVCQKGLRSLSACEQLARIGYPTIAWMNGGLDTARPGQVATVGDVDVRLGGVGGLSEVLGWTEVQQETGGGFAGGYQNILKFFAVILALDLVWFLWTVFNP